MWMYMWAAMIQYEWNKCNIAYTTRAAVAYLHVRFATSLSFKKTILSIALGYLNSDWLRYIYCIAFLLVNIFYFKIKSCPTTQNSVLQSSCSLGPCIFVGQKASYYGRPRIVGQNCLIGPTKVFSPVCGLSLTSNRIAIFLFLSIFIGPHIEGEKANTFVGPFFK